MKIKAIKLFMGLLLLLFCLTGCGRKQVDVQTTLTLKDDNSGSRQIRLTIGKKDFESVFDGTADALKEQLQETCPSAMEWNFSDDGDEYGFLFTLYFSSLEDYAEKVGGILGREVSITMEEPESVFASGLRYREDFTSTDLIGWIGDLLIQEGYLSGENAKDLWKESTAKVLFRGREYEQGAGVLQVDTLIETPVERIDILTCYLQNKHCDRQVIFTFSEESMNKNGDAIKAYLEKQTPDGAKLSWTERNGIRQCTVSAQNLTGKELNAFMGTLFGESRSFISTQSRTQKGIFASASQWSELIDASAFSYNGGRVAVGYYVQWEDGMELTIHRQNTDEAYELKDSEQYGGYQTVWEEDITSESLVTELSSTYVIEEIQVDTEFHKTDYLTRSVSLIFNTVPDEEELEGIRKRIAKKAEGIAEVAVDENRSDERAAITIVQSGSIEEINRGMEAVFSVQGQLFHDTQGDLLDFKHSGSFGDLIDFTGFLENDPILTALTYRLRFPGGESILKDTVSSTISVKQGSQEISGSEYTASITGAYLSVTMESEVWNMDGIMLFMLLLGFAAAALAAVFLAGALQKAFLGVKGKAREIQVVFGKDEEVLEDFPEEEKPSEEHPGGKKRFSFFKKPPFVNYEEIKFEEEEPQENDAGEDRLEEKKNREKNGTKDTEDDWDPEQMVERVTESSLESEDEQEG